MGFGLPDENSHAPNEQLDLSNYQRGILSAAYLYEELAATRGGSPGEARSQGGKVMRPRSFPRPSLPLGRSPPRAGASAGSRHDVQTGTFETRLAAVALAAGLDVPAWQACRADPAMAARVDRRHRRPGPPPASPAPPRSS